MDGPTQDRQRAPSTDLNDVLQMELEAFAREEARRIGLAEAPGRWRDSVPRTFPQSRRKDTTILFGGLTPVHDSLIEAGLRSLGYRAQALPYPDRGALQTGKEFCSRGVCNPTYFTAGSLVNYLQHLRAEQGLEVDEIEDKYVFAAASSCGPCRFGTYVTEYRKALRDSGFTQFRIIDVQQSNPGERLGPDSALRVDTRFYLMAVKCMIIGDILNVLVHRIRPYEVAPGSTDAALDRCLTTLCGAMAERRSLVMALRRCRRELDAIRVDRLKPKPRVAIIGEFWAMHAEGAGNYDLKRFLEAEGAEVEIPLTTTFFLYSMWCAANSIRYEILSTDGWISPTRWKRKLRLLQIDALRRLTSLVFGTYARAVGLTDYRLLDMQKLSKAADDFYPTRLRGGEGHMEVGKFILIAQKRKADLVVSVKPFGCLPSSGVSDGIQALVTTRFPNVEFLSIETTGDGAASVLSRVQMALFKARASAEAEFQKALEHCGLTLATAIDQLALRHRIARTSSHPTGNSPVTAVNLVRSLRTGPGATR